MAKKAASKVENRFRREGWSAGYDEGFDTAWKNQEDIQEAERERYRKENVDLRDRLNLQSKDHAKDCQFLRSTAKRGYWIINVIWGGLLAFLLIVSLIAKARAADEAPPLPQYQVAITFNLPLADGSLKFVTGLRYNGKEFAGKEACDKFLDDQKDAATADDTFKTSLTKIMPELTQMANEHPELVVHIECLPAQAPPGVSASE
jgi:hypothetical protein